jgi:hypothetical protein
LVLFVFEAAIVRSMLPVELVDVFPTLCDILDLKMPYASPKLCLSRKVFKTNWLGFFFNFHNRLGAIVGLERFQSNGSIFIQASRLPDASFENDF